MQTTKPFKSLGLLVLSSLLIFSLSGCKKEPKISFTDLISNTWYAAEPYPYASITFTKQNTYNSEDLLADGRYDILKDGQVYLLSGLNGQLILSPEVVNGEWVLHGSAFDIPFTLTQNERAKPITEEDLQKNQKLENDAMVQREILFMLTSFDWTSATGATVSFSGDSLKVGEDTSYEVTYFNGSISEKGTYIIPLSIDNHSVVCEIEDDWSMMPDFGLNLLIRDGSNILLTASCFIPSDDNE